MQLCTNQVFKDNVDDDDVDDDDGGDDDDDDYDNDDGDDGDDVGGDPKHIGGAVLLEPGPCNYFYSVNNICVKQSWETKLVMFPREPDDNQHSLSVFVSRPQFCYGRGQPHVWKLVKVNLSVLTKFLIIIITVVSDPLVFSTRNPYGIWIRYSC